jgi:SAGA-associated factor 29
LGALYREQVRITDTIKEILEKEDPQGKLSILQVLVKHTEESLEQSTGRSSNSRDARSTMDFDGPSDSPIPSPAENKPVRKLGTGRTSSQPPKDKDTISNQDKTETSESNPNRTKITFSLHAEVAFRPKPGKPGEETDWIQGIVVKIIGEGKSRRYDVQDPFPDEVKGTPGQTHRSSASSMVQIPPLGAALPDYEIGRRVLALYPETSTFYRAEVKAVLDGGSKVQLLFEDETAGAFKIVERRFVLDHKG